MLRQPFFFLTGCLGIQFFDAPPFPQRLCDLRDAMPRHCYDLGFVFIHVKLRIFLIVMKTLIKKQKAAATLINSHKSRNNWSLKKCNSEHWHALKLLPQKMNFRTWVLINSNNWLLIKNLAYRYCRKTRSS